jgi:hypothetical protein
MDQIGIRVGTDFVLCRTGLRSAATPTRVSNSECGQESDILVTQHQFFGERGESSGGSERHWRGGQYRRFFQPNLDGEQGTLTGALERRDGSGDIIRFQDGFVDGLPKDIQQSS